MSTEPVFKIMVHLDGDDYTPIATQTVTDHFIEVLDQLVEFGLIKAYKLEVIIDETSQ